MLSYAFRSDPAGDPASTDSWADVQLTTGSGLRSELNSLTSGPISVNWQNTGANSIDTRVLGSNDPDSAVADRQVVVASGAVAAGAMRHIEVSIAYYQYYWFQQQATTPSNQGASNLFGRHLRV